MTVIEHWTAEALARVRDQMLWEPRALAMSRAEVARVLELADAVPAADFRGAVEALERYGFHHGDCPAILVDDPGPCGCGWSDTAASLHLFGGQ